SQKESAASSNFSKIYQHLMSPPVYAYSPLSSQIPVTKVTCAKEGTYLSSKIFITLLYTKVSKLALSSFQSVGRDQAIDKKILFFFKQFGATRPIEIPLV